MAASSRRFRRHRPVGPRACALCYVLTATSRSQETFATTLVVSNGLFGLQFLLIPKFFISQFFEKELDAFHLFFARFIGVLILGQCALLKVCPSETTFLPALITQIAVGIMGPLKAQLTLDPKMPIHLFPVITVFVCAGLGLLAF